VASYTSDITVPTFLAQGEADTLFDLQESVATYASLKAQNTPVALQWQSWGHSRSTPVAGELDQRHPAQSYEGQQVLAWFGYYLKHQGTQPPLGFSYFRDWAYNGSDAAAAYATGPLPGGTTQTYDLSGADVGGSTVGGTSSGGGQLVPAGSALTPGTSAFTTSTFGPDYSETSAVESMLPQEPPPTDPPGSSIRFLTAPLPQPLDVVGSPRLTVQLDAPSVAVSQKAGPSGQLVIFAKLYDVDPSTGNSVELPNRLISPVRVSDVTQPVTIELPGIVHEFKAGHQLAVVLAGGDLAYRGSTTPQPVSLTTGGPNQQFTIPLAG
jgi:ABC-2 type transport system ATP-binding protein